MLVRLVALLFLLLSGSVATAQAPSPPALDREAVESIVRDYLLRHPEIIIEAMTELRRRQESAAADLAREVIETRRAEIFTDPATPVGGNPLGELTIVEFFDYHCGYCKQVHEPINALIREDRKLRLVYKELPILTPDSRVAASAALAAMRQGKYVAMHDALMAASGRLTRERVLQIAGSLKLDTKRLATDMDSAEVQAAIERNLDLAAALGIDGTPAFLIGDRLVAGALDIEQLREFVATSRAR